MFQWSRQYFHTVDFFQSWSHSEHLKEKKMSVWLFLVFIQCHKSTGKSKFMLPFSCKVMYASNKNWCWTGEICVWSDEPHSISVYTINNYGHQSALWWLSSKGICLESDRLWFNSCFRCGSFSGLSHICDLEIGTPVATLPGALHYRISTGTGQPSVRILWLGEIVWSATSISMWQHMQLSEQIGPWDTLACWWTFTNQWNNCALMVLEEHALRLA